VTIADRRSFTRAAEMLGTTQGALSVRLKRLESRVGYKLIERTPRMVRVAAPGVAFLDAARALIEAHDRAVETLRPAEAQRFTLGIAAHLAGPEIPKLLARLAAHDPGLTIEVRLDTSRTLLDAYEGGELDVAIVGREDDRRTGDHLASERIAWFAAPGFDRRDGEPLRLAALSPACGVHDIAKRALDAANIAWSEVFLGGGSTAVMAAVSAGIAVAPFSLRIAPPDTEDVGPRLGLPDLPPSDIILHSSLTDRRSKAALRALSAAFKEHRRPRV